MVVGRSFSKGVGGLFVSTPLSPSQGGKQFVGTVRKTREQGRPQGAQAFSLKPQRARKTASESPITKPTTQHCLNLEIQGAGGPQKKGIGKRPRNKKSGKRCGGSPVKENLGQKEKKGPEGWDEMPSASNVLEMCKTKKSWNRVYRGIAFPQSRLVAGKESGKSTKVAENSEKRCTARHHKKTLGGGGRGPIPHNTGGC